MSSPATVEMPEDVWCDLEIEVKWTSTGPIDAVPVGGFDSFETEWGEVGRTIHLNPGPKTATLE